MRTLLLILALPSAVFTTAQEPRIGNDLSGTVSLGVRSGLSFFNDGDRKNVGQSVGGQFRVQIAPRVNTDWFLDLITAPTTNGSRRDLHIGWSVLYYLRRPSVAPPLLQPYVLAGHCFDHTSQFSDGDDAAQVEGWSGAVQAGLGTHFNITERFDISPVLQYMIHLGHEHEAEGGTTPIETEHGSHLEGHLLFTVSMNWKLFDAW